jgi:hypothetical protein
VLPAPGRRDTGSLMHGGGVLGTVEFGSFPEDRTTPLTAEELADSVRRVAGVDVTITALDEPKRVLDHARQATPYRLGRVLLAGLHTRYPLPYPTGGHPLLGAHCPDLAMDGSTLYRHTVGGGVVLLAPADYPSVAEAAAPWADRPADRATTRATIVAAAELDRDDLTGLLLRPDGVVAWAAAPDRPADTAALRTALHTWLGDPG